MDIEKVLEAIDKLRRNPKLARDTAIVAVLILIGWVICAVTDVDIGALIRFITELVGTVL